MPLTIMAGGSRLAVVDGYSTPEPAANMVEIFSGGMDDGSNQVNIPFPFYINGNGHTAWHPGSNSYLLTGSSSFYNSLSLGPNPHPPLSGFHFGAADNSIQRLCIQDVPSKGLFRIRYEGTASSGGSLNNPNIIWVATLFDKGGDNKQYLEVAFGIHNRTLGTFGVTHGYSGGPFVNGGTITANSSYVFESDASGNNWIIHPGKKVIY
ncbi:MAG TPA: hypothetical protein V6D07_19065 [Trichocoleus sp.]